MLKRWWTYQRERFPVLAHGALIAAFSFSAVCFSTLLRGQVRLPEPRTALVAFGTAFLFFLQLRIADEFKDYEDDSKYRPYRPVPRGLVSLRELGTLGLIGGVIQLLLATWLDASLLLLLLVPWTYLTLMSKEFFVHGWLKAHPTVYLLSHMVIIPLVDLYATACDWWPTEGRPPHGLIWFLVVSYSNGVVIELGRKIRAPGDEETGVETYSMLWGRGNAVMVWLGAMLVTAVFAGLAAAQIAFLYPAICLLVALLATAGWVAYRFLKQPVTRHARWIETLSGVWTLLMYLSLGTVPLIVRCWLGSGEP